MNRGRCPGLVFTNRAPPTTAAPATTTSWYLSLRSRRMWMVEARHVPWGAGSSGCPAGGELLLQAPENRWIAQLGDVAQLAPVGHMQQPPHDLAGAGLG